MAIIETIVISNAPNTSWSFSNYGGQRIYCNVNTTLTDVIKTSTSTASNCILKTDAWDTIATVSFSGNTATFSNILTAWTYYRIECWNSWGWYTLHYSWWSFPQAGTSINIISWSKDWSDWDWWSLHLNIYSITTSTESSTTNASFLLNFI
jgi:hypothetical protein